MRITHRLPRLLSLTRPKPHYNNLTIRMSSTAEAVNAAQSRAQEAAKSDSNDDKHAAAQGDIHESVQQASGENSQGHATGSGMKDAGQRRHDESKAKLGDAEDRVEGVGSSSS